MAGMAIDQKNDGRCESAPIVVDGLFLMFVKTRPAECSACGFDLKKVTRPRCSECGEELTLEI